MLNDPDKIINFGITVINTELRAIEGLKSRLDGNFVKACTVLHNCQGRIVTLGMGKSGHIAKKIAATFASTGSPAFFVHPGEASHGDLGMLVSSDVAVILSHSGETDEILILLPRLKKLKIPIIVLSSPKSKLAVKADIFLNVQVDEEACPMGLAPTASTSAALVMGDALAISVLQLKKFNKRDFALSHPSGRLGRQLTLTALDLMHSGEALPVVSIDAKFSEALLIMNEKRLGMIVAVNEQSHALGLITDGDLRRFINDKIDIHQALVKDLINPKFAAVNIDSYAIHALNIMQSKKITVMPVLNDVRVILGVLHIHDLIKAGLA